jgi:hypothetical protein
MSEIRSTLDDHLALLARIVARFVASGLTPITIDIDKPELLLDNVEDKGLLEAVLTWMLAEELIRSLEWTATSAVTALSSIRPN